MEKAQVLEVYKIDDDTYQGTCTILELKNPNALTGAELNEFDKIRGWFDKQEVKSFGEAKKRFKVEAKAEAEKKPGAPSKEVVRAFDTVTEAKADTAVETALNVLDDAAQSLEEGLVANFYGNVLKRLLSPEIQARLKQSRRDTSIALEGEITVDVPALQESKS